MKPPSSVTDAPMETQQAVRAESRVRWDTPGAREGPVGRLHPGRQVPPAWSPGRVPGECESHIVRRASPRGMCWATEDEGSWLPMHRGHDALHPLELGRVDPGHRVSVTPGGPGPEVAVTVPSLRKTPASTFRPGN